MRATKTAAATSTGAAAVKITTAAASGFSNVAVRKVVVLDLTACFGANYIPSQVEMDFYMFNHPNYINTQEVHLRTGYPRIIPI